MRLAHSWYWPRCCVTNPFGPAEPSYVTTTYSVSFGQALAGRR
jgi:hypothetical protein